MSFNVFQTRINKKLIVIKNKMENPIAFCFQSEQLMSVLKVSRREDTIHFSLFNSTNVLELSLTGPCESRIRLSLPILTEAICTKINFCIRIQDLIQSLELIDGFGNPKEETGKIIIEYNFSESIKLKPQIGNNIECQAYLVNSDLLEINNSRKIIGRIGGSSKYFRKIFASCFNLLKCEHYTMIFGKKSISLIKNRDSLGSTETKLYLDNLSHNKKLCLECQEDIGINIAEAILNIVQNFLKVYDGLLLEILEIGACFVLTKNSFPEESTLKIYVH